MKTPLLELLPNRVRRNYAGGALLDRREGLDHATDGNRPEDWLASTTPAINRGMENIPDEGFGHARTADGCKHRITDLFARHGAYYLGGKHFAKLGPNLGFLAKLLDSSMRLHTQVHPTRKFARDYLGSPWGKLECYVILGVRPGYPGELRMGFQHPQSEDEWKRIIETQDIKRMDACFTPIRTQPGEVWLVPGGMVHALGAGLLLLEVMEPSDLVVRCEFEREGILVPPEARFMGRDLEFCLNVFDYTAMSPELVRARCQMQPRVIADTDIYREEIWVPFSQTNCFEVRRLKVRKPMRWQSEGRFRLVVVGSGAGSFESSEHALTARTGTRFLVAAKAAAVMIRPQSENTPLELWVCMSRPELDKFSK